MKKIKTVLIVLAVIIVLLSIQPIVIIATNHNRFIEKDNKVVLSMNSGDYYEAYDLANIRDDLTEYDADRLNHIEIDYKEQYSSEYVYYSEAVAIPFINLLNRDQLHKAVFFGNTFYIDVGSYTGSQGPNTFREDVVLPKVKTENIKKIKVVGSYVGTSTYLYYEQIDAFLKSIIDGTSYIKEDDDTSYNIWVYYNNSDEDIYETFQEEDFIKAVRE